MTVPEEPYESGGATEAEVVAALVATFRDLFDDDAIDEESDFIALGGNSLLAVRLRARVREGLGRDLELIDLFYNPTPRELAACVRDAPLWDASETATESETDVHSPVDG
jgi:aryl carrier-like protein